MNEHKIKSVMRNIIQSICLFSVLTISVFFQSCRKDDDNGGGTKDPCDNTVEVFALEPDYYPYLGHFELLGNNATVVDFAPSQTYLKIVNWSDYSDKVVSGRKYKIAYQEVDCGDESGTCGDGAGRCGTPIIKCAKILCLKACPYEEESCFSSELITSGWQQLYSKAVTVEGIEGNLLKASVYYSGCSDKDLVQFRLLFNPISDFVNDKEVVEVKIDEVINTDLTCQAVFTRHSCFDLSAINQYFEQRNGFVPESVVLRIHVGENPVEMIYNLR